MRKKVSLEKEIDIKINRAVRELGKNPFNYSKKYLYSLSFQEIEKLYFDSFSKKLERRSRISRKSEIKGKIYIIGNMEFGVCKIGYSEYPKERLKCLQTGCPYKLEIISVFDGNIPIEKQLHKKYSEYHSYGEWFFIKGALKDVIENYRVGKK